MRSPEDIAELFRQRRSEMHPIRRQALEVRDVANDDFDSLALPMPELTTGHERVAVANLLVQGIDGDAQRITSTFPEVTSAALKRGNDQSERYAQIRRRAALGWVDMNHLPMRMGRRARHLLAYSTSPVMLRPDRKRRIPRWQVRDPLSSYPAPTADFEDVEPPDCIFAVQRNFQWLLENYPDQIAALHVGKRAAPSDLFDVLEYVDDEQITLLVIGRRRSADGPPAGLNTSIYSGVGKKVTAWSEADPGSYGSSEIVRLERLDNRAGRCTAVAPWRITLDRPTGQYDNMVGKFWWQARLSALELIAIERAIYPSEWVVFPSGGDGKILVEANGREGTIGEIEGGEYHVTQVNPGYKTTEGLDRLERAQRLDGSIPAEYGGESPTNIRTDRRGLSVLGNAVDFKHAEVQTLFERSLEAELEIAAAVDKGYFDTRKSFFVEWRGAQGPLTYEPSKHFEAGSSLKVAYAAAGVDANNLELKNMQKVGAGAMSRRTAMEMDRTVKDVEVELERVDVDQLHMAMLEALKTRAAAGQIPEADLAEIIRLRASGASLSDAVQQVHRDAQQRQAEQPVEGDPAAQPGLADAGVGAEAGGGVAPPAPPADLASLLSAVKLPHQRQAVA